MAFDEKAGRSGGRRAQGVVDQFLHEQRAQAVLAAVFAVHNGYAVDTGTDDFGQFNGQNVADFQGHDLPYPPSKLESHHLPDLDRILDGVDQAMNPASTA